jgi:hypothetical protein
VTIAHPSLTSAQAAKRYHCVGISYPSFQENEYLQKRFLSSIPPPPLPPPFHIYIFIYVNVENNLWEKYGFCRFLLYLVAVGIDSKPTQQYRGPWKYGDLF